MPASNAPQVQTKNVPVLRAAYSDRTAALMSTLARLAYAFPPVDSHRGPAATVPEEFRALGFDKITYFHNGPIDGWAYIAEGDDLVALAFRGTESERNWATNLRVEMVQPPNTDARLRVHKGFMQAFSDLSDGQRGIGEAIRGIAAETAQKGIPIYLTGHSLGGALAQIAAAVFGSDQIAACYTFGSPRVGNAYFDLWVKPPSYRAENYADLVPQIPWFSLDLPPVPYRHSGDARYLPDKTQGSPFRYEPGALTRSWQLLIGLVQLARTRSVLGIEDHSILLYERKLADIAANRSQSR